MSQNVYIDTENGKVTLMWDGSMVCSYPKSTAISQWVWLANVETLAVVWGDKRYHYRGVPFRVIHEMMRTESLGRFMVTTVKPNYEAERVA